VEDRGFDLTRPIYLQIMDRIKRAVARGEMRPGDRAPSQRDLARRLGVNPNTVQRVYRELELEGLLETSRGRGTFVTEDASMVEGLRRQLAREAAVAYVEEMRSLGCGSDEIRRALEREIERGEGEGE